MQIILLVAVLTFLIYRLRWPLFETVFAIILLTPILFYPIAGTAVLAPLFYWLIIAFLCLILWIASSLRGEKEDWGGRAELALPGVFCLVYAALLFLCLLWPDFIAIGERLRDYALLASVIRSPTDLQEPWLAGYQLNYYAYWYRLGHMFATLFNWEVWEVYHYLQAFTYALFVTAQIRLFRSYLRFSWSNTLLSAGLISFGSNWAGVLNSFLEPHNWWGPSRVIKGAITEFPVWSFLLGDLHPHYLNLPLIPFFLTLLLSAATVLERANLFGVALALFVVPPLWLYNSNAWDVPVWLAIAGTWVLIVVLSQDRKWIKSDLIRRLRAALRWRVDWVVIIAALALLSWALFLSSRNIQPADYPLTLVGGRTDRSLLIEVGRHWALPLTLISVALAYLLPSRYLWLMAVSVAPLIWITQVAWPFLVLLFVLNLIRLLVLIQSWSWQAGRPAPGALLLEALGVVSLALLIAPEFVFFDDPYGGENERMNTIFKLYSVNWFLLHAFAFHLLALLWGGLERVRWQRCLAFSCKFIVFGFALLFLVRTIPHRRNQEVIFEPGLRGLSSIEREFPGAAETIVQLSELPDGVVLEAQGGAYNYSTHIATLSAKPAFLGWRNHVDLLLRQYQESQRREQLTEQIYTGGDCSIKRSLLKEEGVSYLVLGPLERKKYGDLSSENFDCLELLISSGQYAVYSTG